MKNKKVLLAALGIIIVICAVILGIVIIGGGDKDKDNVQSSGGLTVFTDSTEEVSEPPSVTSEITDLPESTALPETTTVSSTTTTASATKPPATSKKTNTSSVSSKPAGQVKEYKFRSQKLLDQHFEKHGREFGRITKEEYVKMANELINSDSDSVLSKTEKEDGDYVFFDRNTGYFAVLSKDGYIRTFFVPSQGEKYYNKQ